MKKFVFLAALLGCSFSLGLAQSTWKVQPAGDQIAVDTLPMSTALSSDGKFLLVLNGGVHPPSVSVIDIASKHELSRTTLPDAWLGLTVAPASDKFYVGGGSSGKVFELQIDPAGRVTKQRVFVINGAANSPVAPFVGDVALSPDARILYATDLYADSIAAVNMQTGQMVDRWKTGRRPYRLLLSPNGAQLFVSSWGDGSVYEHQAASGIEVAKIRIAPHPTDMLWINKPAPAEENGPSFPARLFVAAENTNSVFSFGVGNDNQLTALETINISLTAMQPLGMTPSALATGPDGQHLYVACSGTNAVAVVDISAPRSRVLGFVPSGEYPTAVRVVSNNQLAIANGASNSISLLAVPAPEQIAGLSQTVLANTPYRDELIYGPITDAQAARYARTDAHPSPIEHVVYVIAGNGAARLNRATAAIAPSYTAKLSPSVEGGRSKVDDFYGNEPANTPPAGYLWNNALQAGLTIRNYGVWVQNGKVNDPPLAPYTDLNFAGTDMDRLNEFARDWKDLDNRKAVPQLTIVMLANESAVAALSDAVSHSSVRPSTAIFVAGQEKASVFSTLAKSGAAGTKSYTDMSVLRSIEMILGLRPMTQFDASAPPMFADFK